MKINVFDYQDYKELLEIQLDFLSKTTRSFSIRGLTQKAGLKSPGFFREIIQSKRKFTALTLNKTLSVLPFDENERQYFEALVWYQQAKDPKVKDQFFQTIFSLQQAQLKRCLKLEQFDFYSHWIHPVVRELTTYPEIPEDLSEQQELSYLTDYISSKVLFKISPEEILRSIKLLLSQGIIFREANKFVQKEEILTAPEQTTSHTIKQFQGQMIHKAMEALALGLEHPKQNSSLTLTLSESNFEIAKEKIRKLRSSLLALSIEKNTQSQRVFQLNTNLFALSKPNYIGSK